MSKTLVNWRKRLDSTKKPLLVIAYYSKPEPGQEDQDNYQKRAGNLQASLAKLEMPHYIEAIDSLGSWTKNCLFKPTFIWRMLVRYGAGQDLLYVDADAEFHSYPFLLDQIDCDVAAHHRPGHPEIQTGTLYFQYTKVSFQFLHRWMALCKQSAAEGGPPDQPLFLEAFEATPGLRFRDLPPEYCLIDTIMENKYPGLKPVIFQHQASRKLKRAIT